MNSSCSLLAYFIVLSIYEIDFVSTFPRALGTTRPNVALDGFVEWSSVCLALSLVKRVPPHRPKYCSRPMYVRSVSINIQHQSTRDHSHSLTEVDLQSNQSSCMADWQSLRPNLLTSHRDFSLKFATAALQQQRLAPLASLLGLIICGEWVCVCVCQLCVADCVRAAPASQRSRCNRAATAILQLVSIYLSTVPTGICCSYMLHVQLCVVSAVSC